MIPMLSSLILAFAGAAAALDVPTESRAFRDVSLERRCEALLTFLRDYSSLHFAGAQLGRPTCAEGNGIGGARYGVDFVFVSGARAKPLRLDLSYTEGGEPRVRLCDAQQPASSCPERGGDFDTLHENMKSLVPTVQKWATAPAKTLKLYGVGYDKFVRDMMRYDGDYSASLEDATRRVRMSLKPEASDEPLRGKVSFQGKVDAGFLACFACADVACLNESVTYSFDELFLSLSRRKPDGSVTRAGWLITSTRPLEPKDRPWRFVCDVSRYSLQSLPR